MGFVSACLFDNFELLPTIGIRASIRGFGLFSENGR